ncbi:hypothetical protein AVEN_214013-1 [Araneus ventricosus]|uniref:Uncharacterized protein n=1 Tax=Araneus ventricosus TaxID=182803 RepID=A0A4Y2KUT5_ARAVE|nr:hypothetical protein AVEN_214013-1 [Araneus ventricosus]
MSHAGACHRKQSSEWALLSLEDHLFLRLDQDILKHPVWCMKAFSEKGCSVENEWFSRTVSGSSTPDGTTYQRHYWTTDASRLLCKRSTTRNVKKEGSSKQLRCEKMVMPHNGWKGHAKVVMESSNRLPNIMTLRFID